MRRYEENPEIGKSSKRKKLVERERK